MCIYIYIHTYTYVEVHCLRRGELEHRKRERRTRLEEFGRGQMGTALRNGAAAKVMILSDRGKRYALALLGI